MKRIEDLFKKQLAVPREFEEHPLMPTQDYIDGLVREATYPSPLVLPGEGWRGIPQTTRRVLQGKCVLVICSGDNTILPDVVNFQSPSLRDVVEFDLPRQANSMFYQL